MSTLNVDLAYNTCIICNGFVYCSYAKPWMDLETGNSFCLFFPYSPEHLVHTTPKFKNMKPYMYVSINATVKEHSHVSGSASALFVGGFSIMQMGKVIG